jgi:hypothetical protein
MRVVSSGAGWIRFADAKRIGLACGIGMLALAPVAASAQALPRLHITALGLHADARVVRPGQTFHVIVHVHVREKRDRLDELVLPALTNAVDLGDERRRVPAPDGTDFYETLTVAASTVGTATFTPAYIDAIDPATGRALRYSSQPLSVRVASGTGVEDADPGALMRLLRRAALIAGAAFVLLAIGIVLLLRRRRRPPPAASAAPPPPMPERKPASPADPLREAVRAYRARRDDVTLDAVRNALFARAGAAAGGTFADALAALGTRDPQLARLMAVAERARFGPDHERAPAARDLGALLDAYLPEREPVT